MTSPTPTKTLYDANCHCGAVRYTIAYRPLTTSTSPDPINTPADPSSPAPTPTPAPAKVNNCNCSICTKNGYLLIYPDRSDITWHQGYDTLSKYKCSTMKKDHLFCPTCGSSILIDNHLTPEEIAARGRDYLGVNARMIKGIDIKALDIRDSDGWNDYGVPYPMEPERKK